MLLNISSSANSDQTPFSSSSVNTGASLSAGTKSKGAVLASDGFFPFDDTVKMAADYGISSIIQPGGSIRDEDSIKACNELGIKMILTGKRHFLH